MGNHALFPCARLIEDQNSLLSFARRAFTFFTQTAAIIRLSILSSRKIFPMKKFTATLVASFFCFYILNAQQSAGSAESGTFNQWHMLDAEKDGVPGISANRAYEEVLKSKKSTTVVVAIIDSGTETFHPDLRDNIWVNEDEIADNGIDDDKNGYVDDIHGWSFIGGENGDVAEDNLEFTRVYRDLVKKYAQVKETSTLSAEDKKGYERYLKMKAEHERRMKEAQDNLMQYTMFLQFMQNSDEIISKELGKEDYTIEEVVALNPKDETVTAAKGFMILVMEQDLESQIEEGIKHFQTLTKYQLNLDFDPRKLVGDHYENLGEKYYGNNHIDGPEGDHGTHVGGIVGAVRNGVGMNGVADNVRLMVIRCVPNGDERDKDVANAIRYAVDNGARIINMSFGKSFSPHKAAVDEAVKYAESKGVLLVHAAGNDNKNVDTEANFPEANYEGGGQCSTWIEVGASGPDVKTLKADFSNYGKLSVDVFSPGVDIYSTVPGAQYKDNSGTSMASPVTAGAAAVLMSYYPQLTAVQVKEILLKSATDYSDEKFLIYKERKGMGKLMAHVFISKKKAEQTNPSKRDFKSKKVKFGNYSVTGGVINLYNAVKMAEGMK